MIAGADVDARTYLLPDTVTCGCTTSAILAALALDPFAAMAGRRSGDCASGGNSLRARAASLVLCPVAGLRRSWFRRCEARGRRRGLASAADIPLCFAVATGAALMTVVLARLRGGNINSTMKLPFGAFLCPALWLVFYAGAVSG